MNAYVDSSVILRIVLGQADALRDWQKIETGVVSAVAEVECVRMLERLRLRVGLGREQLFEDRQHVLGVERRSLGLLARFLRLGGRSFLLRGLGRRNRRRCEQQSTKH